jgi:signal transduction histidine kinase
VRWSQDALKFFESVGDNSVTLDIVISFGCATQNGEGFEELVNSINSESIRRKVKKVNIIDTSYLYRHTIPEFAKYADSNIETLWFSKNKDAIEKLTVDVAMKPWINDLNSDEFKLWFKQMKIDFAGDENGNGVQQDFREAVMAMAEGAASKGHGLLKQNIDFVLEECAYTCANFRDITMVYPMSLRPIKSIIERYKLNITHLPYKMSNYAEQHKCRQPNLSEMDREIINFITKKADNVNFFIVDKSGDILYKNDACKQQVKDMHVKEMSPKVWETIDEVIKTERQLIVEEKSLEGDYYLSVKAPLIIDGKTEGVIGLAVNVTDRKKAEELEIRNKLQMAKIEEQEEFSQFTARMAHDIISPLISLECFAKSCDCLSEKSQNSLTSIVASIRNIASDLLNGYMRFRDDFHLTKEQRVLVSLALSEAIEHKKYQYKDLDVKFNYSYDPAFRFSFIKADQTNFSRMMSNLINNSVEAFNGKRGVVDVSFRAEDGEVKIVVKDDGKGMPIWLVDKNNKGDDVNSNKKDGHGVGLGQIMNTVNVNGGRICVQSE